MHLVFFAFEPSEEAIESSEAMFWGTVLNDLPIAIREVACGGVEIDFEVGCDRDEFFEFVLICWSAPGCDSAFAKAQRFIG